MINNQPTKSRFKLSKKKLVIFGLALIGLITASGAGTYILLDRANISVNESLFATRANVTEDMKVLNTAWAKATSSTDRLASLKRLRDNVTRYERETCPQSTTVYFSLLSARTNCSAAKEKLASLGGSIQEIETYMTDETKLVKILSTEIKTDASLQEQYDHWQGVTKTLIDMKLSQAIEPMKTRLSEKTQAFADAWLNLQKADTEKNKEAFLKGQTELEAAHLALQEVGVSSQTDLQSQISKMNAAVTSYLDLVVAK